MIGWTYALRFQTAAGAPGGDEQMISNDEPELSVGDD